MQIVQAICKIALHLIVFDSLLYIVKLGNDDDYYIVEVGVYTNLNMSGLQMGEGSSIIHQIGILRCEKELI